MQQYSIKERVNVAGFEKRKRKGEKRNERRFIPGNFYMRVHVTRYPAASSDINSIPLSVRSPSFSADTVFLLTVTGNACEKQRPYIRESRESSNLFPLLSLYVAS